MTFSQLSLLIKDLYDHFNTIRERDLSPQMVDLINGSGIAVNILNNIEKSFESHHINDNEAYYLTCQIQDFEFQLESMQYHLNLIGLAGDF